MNLVLSGFLLSSFELYMLDDLVSAILERKKKALSKHAVIYLVFTVLMSLVGIINNSYLNLFVNPLFFYIFSYLLFEGTCVQKISISLCYYAMGVVPEFIVAIVLQISQETNINLIRSSDIHNLLIVIIMRLITFLFVKIVKQLISIKSYQAIPNRFFIALFVLPIATIFIFISMFYADIHLLEDNKFTLITGAFLLIFANAFMYHLLNNLIRVYEHCNKLSLLYEKSVLQNESYKNIEVIHEKNRDIMHDLNKYISITKELVVNGDTEKAISIFDTLDGKIRSVSQRRFCSHHILNAILSDRKNKTEELGIRFELKVDFDVIIDFIEDIDLISIFGNLLDNAIEAAMALKDGYIYLDIFMGNEGHFLIIDMNNSYVNRIIKVKEKFVTSKVDKRNHGIGLEVVRTLVESYDGLLNIEINDMEFRVNCVVPVSKPDNDEEKS